MFKSLFKKTTIFKVNGKTINTDTPEGKAALEKFDKDMDKFGEQMDEFSASLGKTFSEMDDSFSTLTNTFENASDVVLKTAQSYLLLDEIDQNPLVFNWSLQTSWKYVNQRYLLQIWKSSEDNDPTCFSGKTLLEVLEPANTFLKKKGI